MRTFLVFTDFSKNAEFASEYAVQLAMKRKAALRLIHVFEEPVSVSESEIATMHFHTMKQHILQQLEERKRELIKKFKADIPITISTFDQNLVERIKDLFREPDVKLGIIGLTGSGMANFFLGSNTLNIVQYSEQTILTIPPYSSYRPIKNIVFAYNIKDIHPSDIPVKRIKRILQIFEAHLFILQVNPDEDRSSTEAKIIGDLFKGFSHSIHSINNHDIVVGIKDFAKENKADLIAIIPQKHNFWQNLLKTNHTKAILFRSDVPILSIPSVAIQ